MFVSRKGEAFTQNSDFAVLPSGADSASSLQDSTARPGVKRPQARLVLCECIARPGVKRPQARLV
ncbi:hypothetical protein C8P63_1321, partial [Melghirimyces profundicolus]